jgi:hypothetical protein
MTEIVSGGAKGMDTFAREYTLAKGLKFTEAEPMGQYKFKQKGDRDNR